MQYPKDGPTCKVATTGHSSTMALAAFRHLEAANHRRRGGGRGPALMRMGLELCDCRRKERVFGDGGGPGVL
eukprot:4710128-Prymnesium_polylepis.1